MLSVHFSECMCALCMDACSLSRHPGESPRISSSLLVSPQYETKSSGPILGSCLRNWGLCSQVPHSSEQVVPGLCFLFPGQDQDQLPGGNQPAFLFAGLGGLTGAPCEIQRRICGRSFHPPPPPITLTPLFSPVHFNRIYA